jgi:hypothetical protein
MPRSDRLTRPQNFGKIDRFHPHVETVTPSDGLQHTVIPA